MENFKPTPINDSRLTPDMERIRSGSTQLFRVKRDREFTSSENADVILKPPAPELYAELINGVWCWVNGCPECEGKPRDWMTYVECEKHNVCRSCGTPRSKLKDIPWGGKHGWQCQPCAEIEHENLKNEALKKAAEQEYDEYRYMHNDKVICPHCDSGFYPDYDISDGEMECDICGGKFNLEVDYSVSYSTTLIGERLTVDSTKTER